MGKSRDRATRSGSDPVNIGTSRLSVDSGNIKVTAQDGTTFKKIFAEEVQVGSGNDRVIFKRGSDGKAEFQSTSDGGSSTTNLSVGGSSTVTNPSDLPITGNNAGDTVLVTSTNNLMIYNGSGWYKIATITNANPTISSAGDATYAFATDGTPVTIEIVASDPEGIALQYKYQVTTGSLGSTATVTNSATSGGTYSALAANTLSNNRFFRVTPSTNNAHAGTFAITFSVTDGINTANSSASSFTLAFEVSGSWKFDGTGDYVLFPASSDFNFGTGDFTIEAWVWPDSSASDKRGSWIEWSPDDSSNVLRLFQGSASTSASDSDYDLEALYMVGGTDQFEISAQEALSPDHWNHISLQRVGNTINLLVNGSVKGSASYSGTVDASSWDGYLGTDVYATDRAVTGYMSNVRVVKGSSVYTLTTASGGSTIFDGVDDHLTVAPSSNFALGTGDFTIEMWVYFTDSSLDSNGGSNRRIFCLDDVGNAVDNIQFAVDNGYRVNGSVFFYSNTMIGYLDTDIRSGWHHLAAVRSSGTFKIFLDGNEKYSAVNTQDYSPNSGSPTPVIGYRGDGGDYNGYISNLRIVKGTAVYTSSFIPSSIPLTAISGTQLLTCQNSTGSITDASSNNFSIAAGGNVAAHTSKPFTDYFTVPEAPLTAITNTKLLAFTEKNGTDITTGSTRFDGTNDNLQISSTNIINSLANFTVEAWAFFDVESPSDEQNIVEFNTGTRIIFGRRKTTSGLNAMYVYSSATSDLFTNNAAHDIIYNRWVHLAWVKEGQNFRMYIDGKNVAGNNNNSATNMAATPSASLITIGMNSDGNERMDGYISNLRISSTARYSADFARPIAAFTSDSNTILLTCQNSTGTITDASSNGYSISANNGASANAYGVPILPTDASSSVHVLTPYGDTKWDYVTPFLAGEGGSVYFDGSGDYLSILNSYDVGTSDWTIEFWIYLDRISAFNGVCQFGKNTAALAIMTYTDGKIKLVENDQAVVFESNSSLSPNQWYHIAFTNIDSSNTQKLYINGIPESNTGSKSTAFDFGEKTSIIGGRWYSSAFQKPFKGYISNFRLVAGSLPYTINSAPTGGSTVFDAGHSLKVPSTGTSNDLVIGTNDFTLEFWVNLDAIPSPCVVYDTRENHAAGLMVNFNTSGNLRVYANSGYRITCDTISTGSWHHYAIVRSSGTTKVYLDGVEDNETYSDTNNYTGNTAFIGKHITNSAVFDGYISNLRLVVGTAVYTSNFTPQNAPLTAITNTKLLTCQNSSGSITDASSINHSIDVTNAIASTQKPFVEYFTVPTSGLTAVSNTKLLTCNDSNVINDESTSNYLITVNDDAIATKFTPF